jgi:hypothetical protein
MKRLSAPQVEMVGKNEIATALDLTPPQLCVKFTTDTTLPAFRN